MSRSTASRPRLSVGHAGAPIKDPRGIQEDWPFPLADVALPPCQRDKSK